jgi:gentisate 1,2-dioxygenase
VIHKHPVSDECLFVWAGRGHVFVHDTWVEASAGDCVLAPCGIAHGHRSDGPALFGGFASPPQLDLVIPSSVYRDGAFAHPRSAILMVDL